MCGCGRCVFGAEKVELGVEEGVGLWGDLECFRHDLDGFYFFICTRQGCVSVFVRSAWMEVATHSFRYNFEQAMMQPPVHVRISSQTSSQLYPTGMHLRNT